MKQCTFCKEDLTFDRFGVDRNAKSGLKSRCRDCVSLYWKKRSLEDRRAYAKIYTDRAKERDPDIARRTAVKTRHGMTLEEYDAWVEARGRKCWICGKTNGRLHMDHDHGCCPANRSCEKCRRGLLCYLCNQTIGNLNDNPETAMRMVEYLRGGWMEAT